MTEFCFKLPFTLIINGKAGSGKSHLLKYIMRETSKAEISFDYGIVFSNTAWEGSFNYVPEQFVYEDYNEEVIEKLIKLQEDNLKKKINKQAFIILDDCCSENEYNSTILKKLFIMGRHYMISLILTTQYPHLVPPCLRSNSNFNVFFNIGEGIREMRAVYECYGQRFKNYDEFRIFYYDNIADHKFIMWRGEVDGYQVYKAPDIIPSFLLKFNIKIK